MGNDPLNVVDPTGEDGIMLSLDWFSAGDRDMASGESLPSVYRGVGLAIGFDREGNLEVGFVNSNAEGDSVVGDGAGIYGGLGLYRGAIGDLETTTHTAAGGIGPFGGAGSVRVEETSGGSNVRTDVGSAPVPFERVGIGLGYGGVIAQPQTETGAAIAATREQIKQAGEALADAVRDPRQSNPDLCATHPGAC